MRGDQEFAYLTRHGTNWGPRWALNGRYLPAGYHLNSLLELFANTVSLELERLPLQEAAEAPLLTPIEPSQEVWASGVTYLRSQEARMAESKEADVYDRVYDAERPELFFKALGWRSVGHQQSIRVRRDSGWDVPEPELTLVVNNLLEIVGYTVGNDVSSRSIEGENALYLPQAKTFEGACAIGPGILLTSPDRMRDLPISLTILRNGKSVFEEETRVSRMKRRLEELVEYLGREMHFPEGVFLMTGTGIVPPEDFTLKSEDEVEISVGELTLRNKVA